MSIVACGVESTRELHTRKNTSDLMEHNDDCGSKEHRSIARSGSQMCCKRERLSLASQASLLHDVPASSFSMEIQREYEMKVQQQRLFSKSQSRSRFNTSSSSITLPAHCVLNNDSSSDNTFLSAKQMSFRGGSRSYTPPSRGLCHFWLVFMVILVNFVCHSTACTVGVTSPGWTSPPGDISVEYGKPLTINCTLNRTMIESKYPGKNSSNLYFMRNSSKVKKDFITVIDDMTIRLYIEKPPLARDIYYCLLEMANNSKTKNETNNEFVCMNNVAVGTVPEEPEKFSCTSYNWERLKCAWKPPHNFIDTQYEISFKLPGRASRRKAYLCPTTISKNEPHSPNSCVWTLETDPLYRQPYPNYQITLTGKNVLQTVDFNYSFHHYGHVIPASPQNLIIVNKTVDSVFLTWKVRHPMESFPAGLYHRIMYQSQWNKTWKVIDIKNDVHVAMRSFNLSGLPYANTDYDVRVMSKSTHAVGDDKFGNFSAATFRTLPKLPSQPPKTVFGSFELIENSDTKRDVYLYWQQIPAYLENGDNFRYQITYVEESGRRIFITPNETTRMYARFKGISFNSYRFAVSSTNAVGTHPNSSIIDVPSQRDRPGEPLAFTKIEFDSGVYELSWKPPLNNDSINSYTIFWCDSDRDRPYQCSGYLDWTVVPKTTVIHNITVPISRRIYQFAISANTHNASSGMIWASCTIIYNKFVGKMKSVWINRIGSDDVDVGWKLDCSDRIGVVEGFKIYYCPIVSPFNRTCKEPQRNKTIPANSQIFRGIVTGLKPYTTYMIHVSVFTKTTESLQSDGLLNTTLEAAPSAPPQSVVTGNVTNSTIFVSWQPPTAMNGVLRYYRVNYNRNSVNVDEETSVTLRDLLPYKNYEITVSACTVKCSVESRPIYKYTDVGRPGKIGRLPNVRFINSTHMNISWTKPHNPGGLLDYYQVSMGGDEILNSTRLDMEIPIPDCMGEGRGRVYKFRVRAVNIDRYGEHMYGPWSEPGENNCYADLSPRSLVVVMWVVGCTMVLFMFLCLTYTSKRMWIKCKAMQDVEVKLPPGLATREKLLQRGDQHMRQSSVDSGDSSPALESVTASLTSESKISTDSGTVIGEGLSQNKLLDPPNNWDTSSLRQRNVKPSLLTESTLWDSYVKIAKPGDTNLDETLSLTRSTPNLIESSGLILQAQNCPSAGYISMESAEELGHDSHLESNYCVVEAPKSIGKQESLSEALLSRVDEKPYVSIGTIEPKFVGKTVDFGELAYADSLKGPLVPRSDAIATKPYVQVGLMDKLKPFTLVFPNSTIGKSSANEAFKGYVSVDSMGELQKSGKNANERPKVLSQVSLGVNSTPDVSSKPHVQVSSVFELLKQPKITDEAHNTTELDDTAASTSIPLWESEKFCDSEMDDECLSDSRRNSDAGATTETSETAEEEEEEEQQEQQALKKSGYVPHQRLDKHVRVVPADEQYSKVGVASGKSE